MSDVRPPEWSRISAAPHSRSRRGVDWLQTSPNATLMRPVGLWLPHLHKQGTRRRAFPLDDMSSKRLHSGSPRANEIRHNHHRQTPSCGEASLSEAGPRPEKQLYSTPGWLKSYAEHSTLLRYPSESVRDKGCGHLRTGHHVCDQKARYHGEFRREQDGHCPLCFYLTSLPTLSNRHPPS